MTVISLFSTRNWQLLAASFLAIIAWTSGEDHEMSDTSPSTPTKSPQKFYYEAFHEKHPAFREPRCITLDSASTYVCTTTPEVARRAVSFSPIQAKDGNIVSAASLVDIDLGMEQRISGSEAEIERISKVVSKMHRYFEDEVLSRSEYEFVRGRCKNHHELCAFWTSVGECETNRGFMVGNCAAACRLCLLKFTNLLA